MMTTNKTVRIAYASTSGSKVDIGFEQASEIHVCEVSAVKAREVAVLQFTPTMIPLPEAKSAEKPRKCSGSCAPGKISEKRESGCGGGKKKEAPLDEKSISEKVAALTGVSALFVNKTLHAKSALALNQAHIFTVKVDEVQPIGNLIERVQEMLLDRPPLWLTKY